MITHHLLASLAVFAGFGSLVPSPANASCAMLPLVPAVVTTRDTRMPADGGVLVGFGYVGDPADTERPSADPSDVTWVATDANKPIALTRTALAPGLSVYRPTAGASSLRLANKAGKVFGTFTVDPRAAANKLVAPEARRLTVDFKLEIRGTTTRADLELATAAPAAAVGIIMYRPGPSGNVALAVAGLPDTHDKLLTVEVLRAGGHCANDVAGLGTVSGGERVVFAYVDGFGRLSPTSKPISTVSRKTTTP